MRPMAGLNEPIEPMTLGNMRSNGVRSLDVVLAVPPSGDLERGPVVRSRPVRKRSPPPFQTLSQIGNVITELPAGPAVVPPINGSVCAVGGPVLKEPTFFSVLWSPFTFHRWARRFDAAGDLFELPQGGPS